MKLPKTILCFVLLGSAPFVRADDARFDLPVPRIDVYVTRGTETLPIAQVPELQPNDTLRVRTDLPATQSNHLLLIVAFLRGTTNEPPDHWFTKIETWKTTAPEGTLIAVPAGAQRAMLFVAPETGGDFNTLRSAVKGNPGLFIRANIGLNKGRSTKTGFCPGNRARRADASDWRGASKTCSDEQRFRTSGSTIFVIPSHPGT
jgi:hypothetical protein